MDLTQVVGAISVPRLSFYKTYLGCQSEGQQVGTYLAFQDLSGEFFSVLQMVEVGLRNAINEAAKQHFKSSSWFDSAPQTKKSKELVVLAKEKALSECGARYSDDDVVCRLSLGFWVYMLDSAHRDTANKSAYLWSPEMRDVAFGNAKNPWGGKLTISTLFDEFQKILKLRNRLFHHEPIWKKHKCQSIDVAVDNVRKEYDFLLKALGYVSPGKATLLSCVGSPDRFNKRCNKEFINYVVGKVESPKAA
ncbi:hypothetical protein [Aeromonas hydrophila]|uniref:hypothetical protein n=1 Tax=Aeromonas hydrophila TaxID=644 RepID=UPI002B47D38B|nr:hypothetical protein [Aeromonas hydrophila]